MGNRKLLICGILAMGWYVLINIIVAGLYPGYDIKTFTISELSAIGAPTRTLWVLLAFIYSMLFLGFGFGIWSAANGDQRLRIVGAVIILDASLGLFWPPMHQRHVIAGGGGTLTDTLHLVWAFVHLVLMLVMIGYGAAVFGKRFRIFSAIIVLLFFVFGILTARESIGIEANLPTPNVGLWERLNIVAYMVWIAVFSILLMERKVQPA